MTNLWRNIKFGFRLLRKNPGFASLAILALALGIGANTAIFSVIYGALLAHLPYKDPERLISVWARYEGHRRELSPADYLDLKRQSTKFVGMGAMARDRVTVADSSGPPEVDMIWRTTPGLDEIFGVALLFGRDFLPDEGVPGKDHVAVLDYQFWQDRFGGDHNVLGRTIRINGEPYTIIGVSQPDATGRESQLARLTVPLSFPADVLADRGGSHYLLVQGRLKPGVTLAQANAELQTIGRQIAQSNPKTNRGWEPFVEKREHEWVAPELRSKLVLLFGAVGFVLLIACANVANLLLARGSARRKEIVVRRSLGASHGQLTAQFLTESMILALIGAGLGIALSWTLLQVIMALMPPGQFPTEAEVRLQMPVLLFTLGISIISAVICGAAPVVQCLRLDPNETLKDGSRTLMGFGGRGVGRLLVIGEFALALTLLTAAGLAIHGFWKAASVDFGFRPGHILIFSLQVQPQINQGRLNTPEQINGFYREVVERIRGVPGVISAGASMTAPAMGAAFRFPATIAGRSLPDSSSQRQVLYGQATPGYFDTFGIEMIEGGPFNDFDREGGRRVAVVNQTFVKQFLPGVNPLGQRVLVPEPVPGARHPGRPQEWEIVGVYRDVRNHDLLQPEPEIDVPFWQSPWPNPVLAVRTTDDPDTVRKSIAASLQSIDPDVPMTGIETMEDVVHEFSAGERFGAVLFGSFGVLGVILAALGIYGVMAFAVAQRTREIGLRIAIGAGREQVLKLFLREGLILGAIGLAIGTAGSFTVTRLMRGMWYGISGADPIAFATVAFILLFSALAACYVPARRAARLDPMVVLRCE